MRIWADLITLTTEKKLVKVIMINISYDDPTTMLYHFSLFNRYFEKLYHRM